MLGSAPGTDRLNEWVADLDDDMSVDDLANHIAGTEAFQTEYPAFQTNREFAEAFLGNMLVGLSDELMMGAVGLVEGLLNDGLSRGSLALAVVDALYDISMNEEHPAYADLGMSAMTFANKIDVASHHTLTARMAEPSADAIADVTADANSVSMAIDAIDNPPAPPVEEPMGDRHVLTPVRDDYEGTDLGDVIIAEPVLTDANRFIATLNPFDSIDGGDGVDTLEVYSLGSDTPNQDSSSFVVSNAHVRNVENVVINAQGGVTADMDEWMGLMSVELERFNGNLDITVEGASVMLSQDADHDVSIVGAGGEVAFTAGESSVVNIDSGENDHTTSVSVMGGSSVSIHADGGLSESITSVMLDGGLTAQDATIATDALADFSVSNSYGDVTVNYFGLTELTLMASAFGGKHKWDDARTAGVKTGSLTISGGNPEEKTAISTLNVEVSDASAFKLESSVKDLNVSGEGSLTIDLNKFSDATGRWRYPEDASEEDGEVVGGPYVLVDDNGDVTGVGQYVSLDGTTIKTIDKDEYTEMREAAQDADSISVYDLSTSGTDPTGYTGDVADFVSGEDNFLADYNEAQNNNKKDIVKIDTTSTQVGDGTDDKLDDWLTTSLTSIEVSGETGLTINASGNAKLASVDASESSGKNNITVKATDVLTSVMGGNGNDKVTLKTGTLAESGLMVDLGEGDDTFVAGAEENVSPAAEQSSIHGGDGGNDTLVMSMGSHDITYEEGRETKSIYTGFETLDFGGGSGEYDLARLGVDSIKATRGTSGEVTLKNAAPGTAINVTGNNKDKTPAKATIIYELEERDVDSFFFGSGGVVEANLTAMGVKTDRTDILSTEESELKINGPSQVTLVLTIADQGVEGLVIDSSASAGGTAKTSDYKNIVCADVSEVVSVKLTGNAQVQFKGFDSSDGADDITAVGYVDARENTAGVDVQLGGAGGRVTKLTPTITLQDAVTVLGSGADDQIMGSTQTGVQNVLNGNAGDDQITGGEAMDLITGGTGTDMLTGGGEGDWFIYAIASDSQITFRGSDHDGYDTITDFSDGDTIRLSSHLLQNGNNNIKSSATGNVSDENISSGGARFIISSADTTADTIQEFIRSQRNGLFELTDERDVTKHFVAIVEEVVDDNDIDNNTWIFIDVDGSGDFESDNDMVIKLEGVDASTISSDDIVAI